MSSDADSAYEQLRRLGHGGWGGAKFDARMDGWRREIAGWLANPQFPRSARALELGCGNGGVTSLLALAGFEVTGVDISESAVAWARELFRERGLAASFCCEDVSGGMGRFEDACFDVVVDGNCMHCILGEARPRAFAAVKRVLTAGGVFVVSSMCGAPRSQEARANFDAESNVLRKDGRPHRYLPPAAALIEEIQCAGFRPLGSRVNENDWWDHLWMLATPA